MATVRVTGLREMQRRLARLERAAPEVLLQVAYEEAEDVVAEAKENLVPVRNIGGGALRASGFVRLARAGRSVLVVFGFGGGAVKYAEAVHENPRAGKTGGMSPRGKRYRSWAEVGEWHYLSTAIRRRRVGMRQRVAARARQLLGRAVR